MSATEKELGLLDLVAVLSSVADLQVVRGQVGTVVEILDDRTVLVEFSDDQGRAYRIAPLLRSNLLTLRYQPEAA